MYKSNKKANKSYNSKCLKLYKQTIFILFIIQKNESFLNILNEDRLNVDSYNKKINSDCLLYFSLFLQTLLTIYKEIFYF